MRDGSSLADRLSLQSIRRAMRKASLLEITAVAVLLVGAALSVVGETPARAQERAASEAAAMASSASESSEDARSHAAPRRDTRVGTFSDTDSMIIRSGPDQDTVIRVRPDAKDDDSSKGSSDGSTAGSNDSVVPNQYIIVPEIPVPAPR